MFERFPRQKEIIKKPILEIVKKYFGERGVGKEVIEKKLSALEEEELRTQLKNLDAHSELQRAPEDGVANAKKDRATLEELEK